MDKDANSEKQLLSRAMLESGVVQKLALDRDGENSSVLSKHELVSSRQQYRRRLHGA